MAAVIAVTTAKTVAVAVAVAKTVIVAEAQIRVATAALTVAGSSSSRNGSSNRSSGRSTISCSGRDKFVLKHMHKASVPGSGRKPCYHGNNVDLSNSLISMTLRRVELSGSHIKTIM